MSSLYLNISSYLNLSLSYTYTNTKRKQIKVDLKDNFSHSTPAKNAFVTHFSDNSDLKTEVSCPTHDRASKYTQSYTELLSIKMFLSLIWFLNYIIAHYLTVLYWQFNINITEFVFVDSTFLCLDISANFSIIL